MRLRSLGGRMPEPCMCGADDCPKCGGNDTPECPDCGAEMKRHQGEWFCPECEPPEDDDE